jgi:hypothetical protein
MTPNELRAEFDLPPLDDPEFDQIREDTKANAADATNATDPAIDPMMPSKDTTGVPQDSSQPKAETAANKSGTQVPIMKDKKPPSNVDNKMK